MSTTDHLTEQQVIDQRLDDVATAQALGRLFNRIYVMGQEHEQCKWRAGAHPFRALDTEEARGASRTPRETSC